MVQGRINNLDNAGGGMKEWFQSLPIVTQYWFGATILFTLAGNFEIVSPKNFQLIWGNVTEKFEIWRLLTGFCYAGPFHFSTLLSMYLLLTFSQNYESNGPFNTGAGGGSADYLFMWLFGAITMMVSVPVINLITPFSGRIMCQNMIYYVLYIWSKRHPTSNSNIWGFPVKAMYLPFVYVAISIFTGAPYKHMIHGIVVGHIYYFLVDVVPHVYGKDVLSTPQFLIDQIGVGVYVPAVAPASGAPTTAQGDTPRGGHQWGSGGQRLGRS